MKKGLTLSLIFLLTFEACAPMPSQNSRSLSSEVSLSCEQLVERIIAPSRVFWDEFGLGPAQLLRYKRAFKETALTHTEREWVRSLTQTLPEDDELAKELRSSILFARSLPDSQRPKFLDDFRKYWPSHPKLKESLAFKKFKRHQKRVLAYEKKIENKEFKNLTKRNASDAKERAHQVALYKSRLYEKNYFQCMNAVSDPKSVSAAGLKNANKVAWAITVGGAASALVTYGATNHDLPKDERWWSEIAYVIVTSMAMSYVNAKFILANPKLKMWSQRLPLVIGAGAVEDIGVTALWSVLIGEEDPSWEKIEQLQKDPKFQEYLKEMLVIIEKERLYEKHQAGALSFLTSVETDKEGVMTGAFSKIDPASVDMNSIDDTATRELFLEAYSELEYLQGEGRMKLGGPTEDRYTYNRLIDFIYQPSFLLASALMYQQLCSAANPKMGMFTAISTFMAINIATDALYFYGRREMIDQ
jgi:hypothetical protein